MLEDMDVVVLVSCRFEWEATTALCPGRQRERSPFGEWFTADAPDPVVFVQGGWGKISAAASAQYAIDRWKPRLLVNLGTCGGFRGRAKPGEILVVERTVVYDIVERMTDPAAAIAHYSTDLNLSWLPAELPARVRRAVIASADRDLNPEEVDALETRFGAIAGDWESGSIAWVAARSGIRCLILRGVSDLVGGGRGDAYDGNVKLYIDGAAATMKELVGQLPGWIGIALPLPPALQP
jgi:adenosylhomocysteine nucleosidase